MRLTRLLPLLAPLAACLGDAHPDAGADLAGASPPGGPGSPCRSVCDCGPGRRWARSCARRPATSTATARPRRWATSPATTGSVLPRAPEKPVIRPRFPGALALIALLSRAAAAAAPEDEDDPKPAGDRAADAA